KTINGASDRIQRDLALYLVEVNSMRKLELALPLMVTAMTVSASDFAGHYYLQNVREVGSELLLKPDGSFEYMLAYGAADYWAQGSWRVKDGDVILTTAAGEKQEPFRLVQSSAANTAAIRVRVVAPNGRPVPNIDVALGSGKGESVARTD